MTTHAEEVLVSADHHVIGNAPRGAILRPNDDDPEEGTAVDGNPQRDRPKGRNEYELPGPAGRDGRPTVRRVIEDDWRPPGRGAKVRRVGNAEAAGLRCVTDESPNGVSGHQYRRMVRMPPVTFDAPPGPIEVGGLSLMDRETREYLYDLAEVTAWNDRRPGRGKRGKYKSRQGRKRAETGSAEEADPEPVPAHAG